MIRAELLKSVCEEDRIVFGLCAMMSGALGAEILTGTNVEYAHLVLEG